MLSDVKLRTMSDALGTSRRIGVLRHLVFALLLLAAAPALAAEPELAVRSGPLTLRFDPAAQRISVTDSRTARTWLSDEPALALSAAGKEYRARRCDAAPLPDRRGLRVQLSGFATDRAGDPRIAASTVAFEATLDENGSVSFELLPVKAPDVADAMVVEFPRGFGRTADEPAGYLVLPVGTGGVRPFSRGPYRWDTRVYANGSHGPNMAFLGIVLTPPGEPDSPAAAAGPAMFAIIHTPFDCRLRVEQRQFTARWEVNARPTVLTGTARHLSVNYARRIEYRFLPAGRYTDVAKEYRRHLRDDSRLPTLAERLPKQPELRLYLGAVIKKQYGAPFFDNNEIAAAKRLGLERCAWFVGGWNFGGNDRLYPKRLPPNPKWTSPDGIAGAEGLRRTADMARKAGYVLSVHDNYSDAYENSPDWHPKDIAVSADGRPVRGGVWAGGHQAWIICPHRQLELARPDLGLIRDLIGRGGHFTDVTGAAPPEQCFDPDHPSDRRLAAARKRELMELAQSKFGVAHTEGLFDFLVPACDGAHKLFVPNGDRRAPAADVVPVPLLPLIYHDVVVLWDLRRANPDRGPDAPKYLPPGPYVPLYGSMPSTIDKEGKRIAGSMAGAQLAEMLDHRYLDAGVEMTTFADGTRVVANFRADPYRHGMATIEPNEFLIEGRD